MDDATAENELKITIKMQALEALNLLTERADDYPKKEVARYAKLIDALARVVEVLD